MGSPVWSAPGRVNLIGEHTDYSGGFRLPIATQWRTSVAAEPRDDDLVVIRSRQQPGEVRTTLHEIAPGQPSGWAAYVAGVLGVLRDDRLPLSGVHLVIDGDIPLGAGLSSSAALCCATALAVDDLFGLALDRVQLALIAQRAENEFVGVPCGLMDQLSAMFAEPEHALFLDTRSLAYEHVPFDPSAQGLELLIVDSGIRHALANSEYADRRRTVQEIAATLGVPALRDVGVDDLGAAEQRLPDEVKRRRLRHVVTENARVLEAVRLLRVGRVADMGPLLLASHASLRDDFEVSTPELDAIVDAAMSAGALGARLTGGGFGGFVIVLAPADRVAPITAAVGPARSFRPSHGARLEPR